VRVLLGGAAVSLAVGLMLGGAMQPHLYEGDRPSGPQMFADWAGARSTGPFDSGTTFVNDQGKIPDYVLGTDWKKSMAWPGERAAVSSPREVVYDDPPPAPEEPVTLTRAAYEDAPLAPHAYPSMTGGHPSVIEVPQPADTDDTGPVISG
jgi:hypothetical protein